MDNITTTTIELGEKRKKSFQSEIIDKKEIGNKNYITNARADGALADTSKRTVVVHG
jgi:hypothetical protein